MVARLKLNEIGRAQSELSHLVISYAVFCLKKKKKKKTNKNNSIKNSKNT